MASLCFLASMKLEAKTVDPYKVIKCSSFVVGFGNLLSKCVEFGQFQMNYW